MPKPINVALTALWTYFTWTIFGLINQPWLLSLLLVGVIACSFLPQLAEQAPPLRLSAIALLIGYWLLTTRPAASLVSKGLVTGLPDDDGLTADAIVVLSRGPQVGAYRYEQAMQFWQMKRAPRIFVTGSLNIKTMYHLLNQHQLPIEILSGTSCALTTQDEAIATAAILGPQGVKTIILITDPPHMRRSFWLFKSFGFTVIPSFAPMPPNFSSGTLMFLALREYLGLASYALLGRFQPKPEATLTQPPSEVLDLIQQRQGFTDFSQSGIA